MVELLLVAADERDGTEPPAFPVGAVKPPAGVRASGVGSTKACRYGEL